MVDKVDGHHVISRNQVDEWLIRLMSLMSCLFTGADEWQIMLMSIMSCDGLGLMTGRSV